MMSGFRRLWLECTKGMASLQPEKALHYYQKPFSSSEEQSKQRRHSGVHLQDSILPPQLLFFLSTDTIITRHINRYCYLLTYSQMDKFAELCLIPQSYSKKLCCRMCMHMSGQYPVQSVAGKDLPLKTTYYVLRPIMF